MRPGAVTATVLIAGLVAWGVFALRTDRVADGDDPASVVGSNDQLPEARPAGSRPAVAEVASDRGGPAADEAQNPPGEARDDESLLPEGRAAVAAFNDKYLDVLSFGSETRRQWALQNGYPTAEQVTEAASMDVERLRALAETGDPVYEGLYFDRLLDNAIEQVRLVTDGGTSLQDYLRTPEGTQLSSALIEQANAVLETNSAFAGYLLFRYHDQFTGNERAAFASLYLVAQLGDRRIDRAMTAYAARHHISQETIEVLGEYSVMMNRTKREHRLMPLE